MNDSQLDLLSRFDVLRDSKTMEKRESPAEPMERGLRSRTATNITVNTDIFISLTKIKCNSGLTFSISIICNYVI